MPFLDHLIQDAWDKFLALPMDFWLVSPLITFAFAVFACVFWSLHPMIFNKKLLFQHLPILWVSFQIFAVFVETKNELFSFMAILIFGLFALIVQFKDEIPPR